MISLLSYLGGAKVVVLSHAGDGEQVRKEIPIFTACRGTGTAELGGLFVGKITSKIPERDSTEAPS